MAVGGLENDFGVKYNVSNGGPAPEKITDAIYEESMVVSSIKIVEDLPEVDISEVGKHEFEIEPGTGIMDDRAAHTFTVEVIDNTEDYAALLQKCFDFDRLKAFLGRSDFRFVYDGMNGVAGPQARRVFQELLGAPAESLMNCDPDPEFKGCHPDPNLVYAEELVKAMGLTSAGLPADGVEAASVPGTAYKLHHTLL